jgi:hypothetical protein
VLTGLGFGRRVSGAIYLIRLQFEKHQEQKQQVSSSESCKQSFGFVGSIN